MRTHGTNSRPTNKARGGCGHGVQASAAGPVPRRERCSKNVEMWAIKGGKSLVMTSAAPGMDIIGFLNLSLQDGKINYMKVVVSMASFAEDQVLSQTCLATPIVLSVKRPQGKPT